MSAVPSGGEREKHRQGVIVLPPAGWAAFSAKGELYSFSALEGTNRVDFLRSPEYTYLDGRGHRFDAPAAASEAALVIKPLGKNKLSITRISGTAPFIIKRPYQVRGACLSCEASDLEGKPLPIPRWLDNGRETEIKPEEKALKYVLTFSGRGSTRGGAQ